MGTKKQKCFDILRDGTLICKCLSLVEAKQKLRELQKREESENYGQRGFFTVRRGVL